MGWLQLMIHDKLSTCPRVSWYKCNDVPASYSHVITYLPWGKNKLQPTVDQLPPSLWALCINPVAFKCPLDKEHPAKKCWGSTLTQVIKVRLWRIVNTTFPNNKERHYLPYLIKIVICTYWCLVVRVHSSHIHCYHLVKLIWTCKQTVAYLHIQ